MGAPCGERRLELIPSKSETAVVAVEDWNMGTEEEAMKIAVLGTGIVGRTLAYGLDRAGHEVTVGTRDVEETLARNEGDAMGNPPFRQWHSEHSHIRLDTFSSAASEGQVVVNATSGMASLAALQEADADNLNGKVLVDVANALDFSKGMPPTLSVANTDSLGEQIQRSYPQAHVVKTLNTVNATVMIEPSSIPGNHNMFVAGENAGAKETTKQLLVGLGWPEANIIDVGGIRGARGMEMYLPLWLSMLPLFGPTINIQVMRP